MKKSQKKSGLLNLLKAIQGGSKKSPRGGRARPVYPSPSSRPVDNTQTRKAGGRWRDKFNAYLELNRHELFVSLERLVDTPFSSLMTIGVLAAALTLAISFYLVVANLNQLTLGLQSTSQISLFLRDEVQDGHARKLAEKIQHNPDVQQTGMISKAQGMEDFLAYSGFAEAIQALESNPLPIVIQVQPASSATEPRQLEKLLAEFRQYVEVDRVILDMGWAQRLRALIELFEQAVMVLSIFLAAGVLLIIANTIRQELHKRRDEIIICKLIGATDGFIRRPFIFTGFWLGFFSAIMAWFVVAVMVLALKNPIENLSGQYDGNFHVLFLSYPETFIFFIVASTLGVTGSWMILQIQLRQLIPE